jgi:hypothetical protein
MTGREKSASVPLSPTAYTLWTSFHAWSEEFTRPSLREYNGSTMKQIHPIARLDRIRRDTRCLIWMASLNLFVTLLMFTISVATSNCL